MNFNRLRTTAAIAAIASLLAAGNAQAATPNKGSAMLNGYPPARQQHELTCEAAATSMATRGILTEDMILSRLQRNVDPYLGYRGNPNGPYILKGLPNYGVYPRPVAADLASFGWTAVPSSEMTRSSLERYLDLGWPVVVWITYQLTYQKRFFKTEDGRRFLLVPFEHAVTAVGYNQRQIIVNDPYAGIRRHYPWHDFMRSWNYLDRMALAVEPCRTPSPVGNIHVARSTWTVAWTWNARPGIRSYDLAIFQRRSGSWVFIKHVTTTTAAFTARGAPAATPYLVRVEAIAPCGVKGTAQYSYSPAMRTGS